MNRDDLIALLEKQHAELTAAAERAYVEGAIGENVRFTLRTVLYDTNSAIATLRREEADERPEAYKAFSIGGNG